MRARIENIYAARGFDAIDGQDLRGRMRWWGLYTQRRPGIDGGKTAILEPHELDDEYFMLRVRIDGGRLTVAQLGAIAEVSTTYARGTADITDRQNVQVHWIRIEDMPAIWQILESTGLQTTEACGDTPRGMLGPCGRPSSSCPEGRMTGKPAGGSASGRLSHRAAPLGAGHVNGVSQSQIDVRIMERAGLTRPKNGTL